MIKFENISLRATKGMVMQDIDLTIEPGECVCVTGKSGSGKSLLLGMLRGDIRPTSGILTVDQVDLARLTPPLLQLYRKNLGVLLQTDQLLTDRSVASNVALGLEAQHVSMEELAMRTTSVLEFIGLVEKAAMLPEALHHGERRRVALAQAVAHDPKILLIDEPVADLDVQSASVILTLLKEAHAQGTTLIVATQNPRQLTHLPIRIVDLDTKNTASKSQKIKVKANASPVAG